MRPCLEPGCPELVERGRCDVHRVKVDRIRSALYTADADRRVVYKSKRWQGLRRVVLKEQPWCAQEGCKRMTEEVDHIIPLRDILDRGGDPFARDNVQGLCKRHHSSKTAKEVWHGQAEVQGPGV